MANSLPLRLRLGIFQPGLRGTPTGEGQDDRSLVPRLLVMVSFCVAFFLWVSPAVPDRVL